MAQKKGAFVIRNSEGVVTLAGIATSLTNDAMSAGYSDATEIFEHKDAGGVLRTLTKDFNDYRITLRLTPGVGGAHADQAAVKATIAAIARGDSIVTSGFEDDQFNWDSSAKGIIWEVGKTLTMGDLMSVDITARKMTTTGGTAIDFTGAWASL